MNRQRYEPRPYAKLAARFAIDTLRCQIIAGMGLGKTSIVLSVLDMLKLAGSSFFPALVLAPKRVAEVVWPTEIAKWDIFEDLSLTSLIGNPNQRSLALKQTSDIHVINYDNIPWLVSQFEKGNWPYKTIIADESTKLKGFRYVNGTVRAKALAKIAKQTNRWINLTGFAAPNGLTDLWGQYWFLDFGKRLMPTYTAFEERWFNVNPWTYERKLLPGAEAEIHEAIADITIALRAEDWLDLKKPLNTKIEVDLPPEAQRIYDAMESDYFAELDSGTIKIEALNAGSKSMKLFQLASGSIYDSDGVAHAIHDAKVEALKEIVNETKEPLLVVYYFKFDVERIKKAFPKAVVLGPEQTIRDWNSRKIEIGLVHPQSVGHGISLQDGGRNIAFFTHRWDADLREQCIERIGPARQLQSGYDRVVNVFDIVARNTMDVEALKRHELKLTIEEALQLARRRRNFEQ